MAEEKEETILRRPEGEDEDADIIETIGEAVEVAPEDVLYALIFQAIEAPETITADEVLKAVKAMGLSDLIEAAKAAVEESEEDDGPEEGDTEKDEIEDILSDLSEG